MTAELSDILKAWHITEADLIENRAGRLTKVQRSVLLAGFGAAIAGSLTAMILLGVFRYSPSTLLIVGVVLTIFVFTRLGALLDALGGTVKIVRGKVSLIDGNLRVGDYSTRLFSGKMNVLREGGEYIAYIGPKSGQLLAIEPAPDSTPTFF